MITDDERRARLAARHLLLPEGRTDDIAAICESVVALHSSDPVSVHLSAMARMRDPSITAVEQALYEDRTVLRHHAMRRTLWVATPATTRMMHAAATQALAVREHRRTVQLLAGSGIDDPEGWLQDAYAQVLADLREHGPSTARDLGRRVPALRHPIELSPGTPWAQSVAAHTRVLLSLGFRGALLRTRPTGSWLNGAYRYAAGEDWLDAPLSGLDTRAACRGLAEAYLRRFGPVSTLDLRWWTGWTLAVTNRALADCGAVEVDLAGGRGWLAADDSTGGEVSGPSDEPAADPWVAVLPSLDPTTMGWKERDWYLPPAAADAFDRNGNAGPTLWVDGRVVGAWAQGADGVIRTHYFEPVPARRRRELDERIADLTSWVGGAAFTIRFPGRIQASILAESSGADVPGRSRGERS